MSYVQSEDSSAETRGLRVKNRTYQSAMVGVRVGKEGELDTRIIFKGPKGLDQRCFRPGAGQLM
jgi:hypothetical protein